LVFDEILHIEVFEVAGYESAIYFAKKQHGGPEMATFFFKLTESYQNQYMRVFEVAQYDFNINFSKNKMVNPKWRTFFFKS
jgi:hypothetical protein